MLSAERVMTSLSTMAPMGSLGFSIRLWVFTPSMRLKGLAWTASVACISWEFIVSTDCVTQIPMPEPRLRARLIMAEASVREWPGSVVKAMMLARLKIIPMAMPWMNTVSESVVAEISGVQPDISQNDQVSSRAPMVMGSARHCAEQAGQ